MVQVPYYCQSCYSTHNQSYHQFNFLSSCHTSTKTISSSASTSIVNKLISSSLISYFFSPFSLIIMDIFVKFYYLLVGTIKTVIVYSRCFFQAIEGTLLKSAKDHYFMVNKHYARKEFFLRNMKHKHDMEVVKVKTSQSTKSDKSLDTNHISRSNNSYSCLTRTLSCCKGTSTFLLVLLGFISFLSTTQPVTAMVNNIRPPPESSLTQQIQLSHTSSSSSVSNSEQQPHPSHNIDSYSNQIIDSHTHHPKFQSTNLKRQKKSLIYHQVSSSHEQNRAPQQNRRTMRAGSFVVDLLSAFGIFHNISVHEPNVVLRPGAHSSAPAAFFSSSYQSDSGSVGSRNVRLHLESFKSGEFSSSSQSSSQTSKNESPDGVTGNQQNKSRIHKHSIHSKTQLNKLLENLFENQDNSIHSDHFYKSNTKSDNVDEGLNDNDTFDNEDMYHHFSSSHGKPLELSIMASLKQLQGNSGTLVALMHYSQTDSQYHRLLELQSSGRKNVLRLIYRTKLFPHEHTSSSTSSSSSSSSNINDHFHKDLDDIILSSSTSQSSFLPTSSSSFTASPSSNLAVNVVENIPLVLADNKWHKIAVGISGNQLQVFLDCKSVVKRTIRPLDFRVSNEQRNISMWIGQQSQKQFYYKGYIQNFHLVSGKTNAHSMQCPMVDTECPTCGEFRSMQELVRNMQLEYQQEITRLKDRLQATEEKVSKLEECDCTKSCQLPGGIIREDGASWSEGCQLCSCVHGVVSCRPPQCPALNCTDPNPPDPSRGICCPSCKVGCQINKIPISHGSSHRPRRCVECACDNGRISCTRQDPVHDCPKLNCPLSDQIQEEGECCKICKSDFCSRSGHNCHAKATCRNGPFNYTCHCHQGFIGNGFHCEDHNECDHIGHQGNKPGHFCTEPNSVCVNTIGSYKCECKLGFRADNSQGRLKCLPINLCIEFNSTTTSDLDETENEVNDTLLNNVKPKIHKPPCNENAQCEYTGPGQHRCICNDGFTGDGKECKPICEQPCENGGLCVAPNQCQCPVGFTGTSCKEDINECLLSISVHKCGANSRCVNKPGWHFCECDHGFRAYQDPTKDGQTICVDNNECELGTATCHQSTNCWNTKGSYQCYCQHSNHTRCSKDCVVDDNTIKSDGQTWNKECNTCTCNNGKVVCEPKSCDCNLIKKLNYGNASNSNEDLNIKCCSHCFADDETKQPCSDSDGQTKHQDEERWLHECQECECKNGESDCWPVACPPIFCKHPVFLPGSCCPTCVNILPGDCQHGNESSSLQKRSCYHNGKLFRNGDIWPVVENADEANTSRRENGCTSCKCKVPFCDEQRVSRSAITDYSPSTSSSSNKSLKLHLTNQGTRMDLFIVLLILHVLWMLNWSICLPQQYHQYMKRQNLLDHPHHHLQQDLLQPCNPKSMPMTSEKNQKQIPLLTLRRRHNVVSSNKKTINRKVEGTKMLKQLLHKHRSIQGLKKSMKLIRLITPVRKCHCPRSPDKLDLLLNNELQSIKSGINTVKHLKSKDSAVQHKAISLILHTHKNKTLS